MWVWLATRISTSSAIPKKLIEHFGSVYNLYNASEAEYKAITRSYEKLLDKDISHAMDIVEYTKKNSIGIITYNQLEYPLRLKKLENCPMVLYYIGELYDLDYTPSVGVVGTRGYSEMGEKVTKRIAYDLARSGFNIISGLAKGIDSFSHRAALYNESPTVAVLGCGIDVVYPPENRELTMRIRENGLVLTEYHPGTRPLAHNFPARNRIISGLSDAVLVIECNMKSGTMITAEHAFDHNIPVYMYEPLCRDAAPYLLHKGAAVVTNSDGITFDFKKKYPELKLISELPKQNKLQPKETYVKDSYVEKYTEAPLKDKEPKPSDAAKENGSKESKPDFSGLDDRERKIVEKLTKCPLTADKLISEDTPIHIILRILTSLELKGIITSLPGGRYSLNK